MKIEPIDDYEFTRAEEFFTDAMEHGKLSLKFVPIELKTLRVCAAAITHKSRYIEFVPPCINKFKLFNFATLKLNEKIRSLILSSLEDERNICYLPHQLQSHEFYFDAVKESPDVISYVPKEFLCEELCLHAIKFKPRSISRMSLGCKTKAVCLAALAADGHLIQYVQKSMLTKELVDVALRQNPEAIKSVKQVAKKMVAELLAA